MTSTLTIEERDDRVVVTVRRPEARNAINAAMVRELHASPAAVFGNPEPGLGILAAAGASWRLRDLVGQSVAKQVLLGGRRLDADDAYRFGLVAEVVPADELVKRAQALLDRMGRSGALALRLIKLVADHPGGHPLTDDLAQAILFESGDKRARMDAFLSGGRS